MAPIKWSIEGTINDNNQNAEPLITLISFDGKQVGNNQGNGISKNVIDTSKIAEKMVKNIDMSNEEIEKIYDIMSGGSIKGGKSRKSRRIKGGRSRKNKRSTYKR